MDAQTNSIAHRRAGVFLSHLVPPSQGHKREDTSNQVNPHFEAWAAYKAKDTVKPFQYVPRPLGDEDIEIKITHCGICASDIHTIDNGWGGTMYPVVPGHEIVGTVAAKGGKVTSLNIGDRVGVGAQVLSCRSCSLCNQKLEQYCRKGTGTYSSKYPDGSVAYGGYAKNVRVHSGWAFKIPENLKSAEVAPLFCAGATVFEPMKRFGMTKGHKVGVIAIGGLGHLAIQFAAALGCEVSAISHSPSKRELAAELGAKQFICTPEELKKATGFFDFLIMTDNVTLDISKYLRLLKPLGALVLVGVPEDKLKTDALPLLGRTVHGSSIASPSRIKEMLELAAAKNIKAYVQEFNVSQLNEALDGVRAGKPRFRYVINMQD